MFSKMPVTSQLTQPATLAICHASGSAVATTPALTVALAPQRDADAGRADEQQRVHRREHDHEARDQPHVRGDRAGVVVDRLAHVGVLVARAREELHRQDVGVAVDDAAHHERAQLGARPSPGRASAARSGAGRRRSRRTTAPSGSRAASRPAPSAPAPNAVDRRCTRPRGCSTRRIRAARCSVCITRLAMRPAKSFWKNGQLCRTTCQWLCQRIRLVTPGTTRVVAHEAVGEQRQRPADQHERRHADQHRHGGAKAAARSLASISVTSLPMNTGISVSISATREARGEHRARTARASGGRSASRTRAARAAAPPRAARSDGCGIRRTRTWWPPVRRVARWWRAGGFGSGCCDCNEPDGAPRAAAGPARGSHPARSD